jgi:K(+)-stimulated pyrophosphate-energized sodium pump
LVIAPILGNGHGSEKGAGHNGACKMEQKCHGEMEAAHCNPSSCNPATCEHKGKCDKSKCEGEKKECHGEAACKGDMMGKCDMSECAKMTKEECAKMCDSKGCSPEEKAMCMAHYGKDGKFIGGESCKKEKSCCKMKKEACKDKSGCKQSSCKK